MSKHIAIVMINWNGAQDTIECLTSLWNQSYQHFHVVLIDNHSTDNSVHQILNWLKAPFVLSTSRYLHLLNRSLPTSIPYMEVHTLHKTVLPSPAVYFLKNSENIGFARASNQGIQFAQKYLQPDYIFLLNNDTFLLPDVLAHLVAAAEQYPHVAAFQSAIYYYDNPRQIWNVGGRILPWGQTRYYRRLPDQPVFPTQTVIGCALFLPRKTVETVGLLSEKFFHGEEDLNYSLRLRKARKTAVVVRQSIVYHKIARSSQKQWNQRPQRLTNAALNRFLNFKEFYSPFFWHIWRLGSSVYYWGLLVFKYHRSMGEAFRLIIRIFRASSRVERVTPATVAAVIKDL